MNIYIIATILILKTSVFLILVVLVQNSKGGGLDSPFAASNQIMGVKKTNDFIEKATWFSVIIIVALSMIASFAIPRGETSKKEEMKSNLTEYAKKAVSQPFNPNNQQNNQQQTPPPTGNPQQQ
jgi:preprotein translocase subunit SecG